jgi:hypothetical protein
LKPDHYLALCGLIDLKKKIFRQANDFKNLRPEQWLVQRGVNPDVNIFF